MSTSLLDRFEAVADTATPDWLDVERRARRIARRRARRTTLAAVAATASLAIVAPALGIGAGPLDGVAERLTAIVDGLGDGTPREMEIAYDPDTRIAGLRGTVDDDRVVAVRLRFADGSEPLVASGSEYDFEFDGGRLEQAAVLEGVDAAGNVVATTDVPAIFGPPQGENLYAGEFGYAHVKGLDKLRPGEAVRLKGPLDPNVTYCVVGELNFIEPC